jgi:four helix bundle protein
VDERRFKERTKQLGLRVIRVVEALPRGRSADVIGRQLLRSATSVGANYRAACRGRSAADVISKVGADESIYWMELLIDGGFVAADRLKELLEETNQIVAMTVASIKTLRFRSSTPIPQSKIQNRKSKIE